MVRQSQQAWQPSTQHTAEAGAQAPRAADWMHDVLGEHGRFAGSQGAVTHHAGQSPADDLQSRLAAIARNIETLESRVSGQPVQAVSPAIHQQAARPDARPSQRAESPVDALRRRKRELELGMLQDENLAFGSDETSAHSAPGAGSPRQKQATQQSAPHQEPAPHSPVHGEHRPDDSALDRLAARLDDQFARLSEAMNDVRDLAKSSAGDQAVLEEKVAALQSRLEERGGDHGEQKGQSNDLSQLSEQIRSIQNAILAMPRPEAIRSLEEGYSHVLARLDTLKTDSTHDDKIDALYAEVTRLREVLDNLDGNPTSALVGEMRSMIAQLESGPAGDTQRIVEALESVKDMARTAADSQDNGFINEAIGAVVERLVALEARIEALASSSDDGALAQRLDAIQEQMAQLSSFQDEARGLTSALDTIRDEMRSATPGADLAGMDQRLAAFERVEKVADGLAEQVSALSARLDALDGTFDDQAAMAREIANLAQAMETARSALPVHEIEHALLDLTGRVTALQEDTSAQRLGMAVHELGQRVEACLKSIPSTEAIINAVEAKIDSRMSGAFEPVMSRLNAVDERLDVLHRTIDSDDAPLIDHMAGRLDEILAAMPGPRADASLAALEKQVIEMGRQQLGPDGLSRQDVLRLQDELARVRANVELGSNADLQRSIVEEVRDLGDRFDAVRVSGDAAMLPQIERQIDALGDRLRSLGLFDASAAPRAPDTPSAPASALSMPQPGRAERQEPQNQPEDKAPAQLPPSTVIDSWSEPAAPEPSPHLRAPSSENLFEDPKAQQAERPEPGDAQTLLRQLSGAINAAPEHPERQRRAAADPQSEAPADQHTDASSQRAHFIAAARRAAQAAALQAGGGKQAGKGSEAFAPTPPLAADAASGRIEPELEARPPSAKESRKAKAEAKAEAKARASKTKDMPEVASRRETQENREKRQRGLSRAMFIALLLFIVGMGLFVANLILPADPTDGSAVAPDTAVESPAGVSQSNAGEASSDRIPASDAPDIEALVPSSAQSGRTQSELTPPSLPTPENLTAPSELVGGFERSRGPVMAQTPPRGESAPDQQLDETPSTIAAVDAEDILPPPGNDMGPLLNPQMPPLPTATTESLPEAIGSPRLRVAAAGGDAGAAFEIANRYMEGRFVEQDLAAAAHWYGRAATRGVVPAAFRLGSLYEQGRGVDRNRDGAIAWYERAALGGNPRAMHNLAVMAAEGGGEGPDFVRAASWFIPAANRGLADSQFNLAVLYARGMGVERDLMESYKWFALAANAGDNEALGRRDEVAGVLGEQALALARARVDNWRPVPVDSTAVDVEGPAGGWDDSAVSADASNAAPPRDLVAEAQSLLARRGYDPGPADGMIGPRTNDAVRAFRQSVGLGDSPQIDQALLDALRDSTAL